MDLTLKHSVNPPIAIDLLQRWAQDAENRRTVGHDGSVAKQQFQQWVDGVESSLTQAFTITSVLDFIQTNRYLHILDMDTSAPRAEK
jgi:hypothetical protein